MVLSCNILITFKSMRLQIMELSYLSGLICKFNIEIIVLNVSLIKIC